MSRLQPGNTNPKITHHMNNTFVELTGSTGKPVFVNPRHVAMVMANPQPEASGSIIILNLSVGTMEERAVRPEMLPVKESVEVVVFRMRDPGAAA